jgi:hypothetical protein
MATTVSNTSTLDRSASRRHHHHHQSSTAPSRSQSTRVKPVAPPSASPQRTNSEHHRANSRHKPVEEILPQANYETSNVAQTSRRTSREDQNRSSSTHRHHHQSRYSSDMSTAVANGGGPAPVVNPQETRQSGKSGKSRTTIPAPTGNWILGKTIGAGSMGKVKLARRAEGGEQVNTLICYSRPYLILTCSNRSPSRLSLEGLPTTGIIKAAQIGSAQIIRKRFVRQGRLP